MSYKIAIASGKGGTGKTTVSVNLFHFLNEKTKEKVALIDCDVEEPNDAIFFPDVKTTNEKEIFQLIPEINIEHCTFCRKCVDYCEFNAIVVIPSVKFAEVNGTLCHSCGACLVACQDDAITEKPESIGKVSYYRTEQGEELIEGRLKIGSAMQTTLIKSLKSLRPKEKDIILYDAPPGTSCPVVETVSDTDYVILVTEPTLFGLHDLKLMVELLEELEKPFGVIVNKAGLGDLSVYKYLNEKGIELLGEIPFSKGYAAAYAGGQLFDEIPEDIRHSYQNIIETLEQKIVRHEGNNNIKR